MLFIMLRKYVHNWYAYVSNNAEFKRFESWPHLAYVTSN